MSLNILSLITQFWTLKDQGLFAPWYRVKIFFLHCGRILWNLSFITDHSDTKLRAQSFTRYLILNIILCDLWKNSQIYRNTSDSFAKTTYSRLSFSSFSLSVYDIWVNIITRDISVSLQNCFILLLHNSNILNMCYFSHAMFFCNILKFISIFELNPYACIAIFRKCTMSHVTYLTNCLILHCIACIYVIKISC